MFRVCHEEALVAVKKLDENESNLETYENPAGEEKCVIVNIIQGFVEFKLKKIYLFTYNSGYFIPTLEVIQMSRL